MYLRRLHPFPFVAALGVCLFLMSAVWLNHAASADDEKEAPANAEAADDAAPAEAHEPTEAHDPAADQAGAEKAPSESHGDHDTSDRMMHGNASDSLESPAEFMSDLAIYTAAVFLVLMAILGKFAWGPIIAGLEAREQGIAGQIAEAKQAADDAQETLRQYQVQVAGAAEEVRQLLDKGRRDADAQRQEIVAEAQRVARQEKDRAVTEIRTAKNQALQEVAQQSADTAVSLAGQIVRRELNKDDHNQLIADAIQQFPSNN